MKDGTRSNRDTSFIDQAFRAFSDDLREPPQVSLRGGADLDSYNDPTAFDSSADDPTDAYIERHAYWALPHLDGRSWRYYLPHLIRYALAHPEDSAMVTEGLVRSLRPPDRFPPRLGSLTDEQEQVVRTFLEHIALSGGEDSTAEDARQALEEWWLPNPRSRPTPAELTALRAAPVAYSEQVRPEYRLSVPDTFVSSGARDIPSESRRVETWSGYICGDVHASVAINILSRPTTFEGALSRYDGFFGMTAKAVDVAVAGARRAVRCAGVSSIHHPGNPKHVILVLAEGAHLVLLTVQASTRDDARKVLERIATSVSLEAGQARQATVDPGHRPSYRE